ncbi:uncharacterized protein LOC116251515 isoform X2 [Nymphaea colorata]|nr:uncharacterized protein LOC116251515 isoform X1 [Nymphaea colorata]XP_049933002.1 uncharacterized protein LOC116251515 isoform X2 [Nymphaea colorata]
MSIGFPRLSWWPWGRKEQDSSVPSVSSSAASSSSSELDFLELDSLNFQATRGARLASTSGKVKRKWHSRKERKGFDREHDMVMVPPDGGCMSGSESDGSDWSIGWLEPHAPEFQNDDEQDNSFAVLVPCYGRPVGDSSAVRAENRLLGALLSGFNNGYSAVNCLFPWPLDALYQSLVICRTVGCTFSRHLM